MGVTAAMVVSPYYVETVVDDAGVESQITHRLAEATVLHNGRYTAYTDWLALPPDEITPDHGLAMSVIWFDDSAEEQAALAAMRERYAVLMEGEVNRVGQTPADWPA